jgi:hypothetical protein
MAFKLTAKTKSILNQIEKNPSVVLDIEGIDLVISSSATFKQIYWDDPDVSWDMDGATWDGNYKDPNTRSYIDLRESTRQITQQLFPDKEGSSSITTAIFSIVDKNNEIAQALSLNAVGEILGRQCDIYLGFVNGVYPDDYMPVMRGIITDYTPQSGNILIQLSHADSLKRQSLLTEYNSQLTGNITNVATTIPVASTERFLPSQDALTSYIQIDSEIMEVTAVGANSFDVIRGMMGTQADSHDIEAEVKSVYELDGEPLVLAQKIMQSDADNSYFESAIPLLNFTYVNNDLSIPFAMIFNHPDIESVTGLTAGDSINVPTYGDFTVNSFGKLDNGISYILVNEPLAIVIDVGQVWSFRSKYNVLNFGLGMLPSQVDNVSFEEVKTNFSPNFTPMNFRLDGGIKSARDFINKELFFVSGCYGIPRNARSSVKFLSPPLSIDPIPVLNETNIKNISDLKPTRSVNDYYYNDILFAFNKSILDGEFKSFSNFVNVDSVRRFKVGNKQLKIESDGFKRSTQVDLILDRLASRFLSRYRMAAEYIPGIKLGFKHGFNLQVGDVVFFGGSNTKQVDVYTGKRNKPIGKYEIINQKIDISGEITIDLLATGFSVVGNFGVFSPASKVAAGSTNTVLKLTEINNLDEEVFERNKWTELFGAKVLIYSEDYSYMETATLVGFDSQDTGAIVVTALTAPPPAGAIVDLADYDVQPAKTTDIGGYVRLKYTFNMFQDTITAVTSAQVFEVADGTLYFDGMDIAVHSEDYARDAMRAVIDTVVGDTITLTEPLGFVPLIGDHIEQLEFADNDGYLFL